MFEFLKVKGVKASILVAANWSHDSMDIESMYRVPATIQEFPESDI